MKLPESGLAILEFTAVWCGACKTLAPIVEAVARERGVRVIAIDVDTDPQLAQEFLVKSMPTVVLWRDGREVGRFVGARPRAFVAGVVDRACAGDRAIASP